MTRVLLRNARVWDGSGTAAYPADVLIEGERIVAAGSSVRHPSGAQLIDLGDTTLLPGLIGVASRIPGTSFTVACVATDTSTYAYEIFEPG